MKFELRKITYSASLSEETSAYTADLYVDGKLLAHVSNRGHGGSDEQHPAKGRTYDDLKTAEDWIKANIPPTETLRKYPGAQILNNLPLEEAKVIFKKGA